MQDFVRKNLRLIRSQMLHPQSHHRPEWASTIAPLNAPLKIASKPVRVLAAAPPAIQYPVRSRVFEFVPITQAMAMCPSEQYQPGFKLVNDVNESVHETAPAEFDDLSGQEPLVFALQIPMQKVVVVSKPVEYGSINWNMISQTPQDVTKPKPPFSALANPKMMLREPFSPQYHVIRPHMFQTPGTLEILHIDETYSLLDEAPLQYVDALKQIKK